MDTSRSSALLMTQKSLSWRRRKHLLTTDDEPWKVDVFPTNFSEIVSTTPPPAPQCLVTAATATDRHDQPAKQSTGRVKVMLRICPVDGGRSSFLTCDPQSGQVTVLDQSVCAGSLAASPATSRRRPAAPKTFTFDAVFTPESSLVDICSASLVDTIQAVVAGQDGCVFSYGHARLGKTYTMLGVDDTADNLGVIPCAISWLYRLIEEQKLRTGARFSVRVSAVEVTGKQESLKDLLANVAVMSASESTCAPGVYLRDDPVSGTQLENQSELRAPSVRHAAYYLDAAIAARTVPEAEDDARNSHLLFTLNVYQYRVDHDNSGQDEVIGGRSRLQLLDLGSCGRVKDGSALSLSALGSVLLALLSGQRHTPYRESKLTQLVRDSLCGGATGCSACMIAHVSAADHAYIETVQVAQLAARLYRVRVRKRNKFSSTSSEDASSQDGSSPSTARVTRRTAGGLHPSKPSYSSHHQPHHRPRNGVPSSRVASLCSENDCTSSSEQSCDTVIYVGKNGRVLSDRELTDNEGPPPAPPASISSFPIGANGSALQQCESVSTTAVPSSISTFHCNTSLNVATVIHVSSSVSTAIHDDPVYQQSSFQQSQTSFSCLPSSISSYLPSYHSPPASISKEPGKRAEAEGSVENSTSLPYVEEQSDQRLSNGISAVDKLEATNNALAAHVGKLCATSAAIELLTADLQKLQSCSNNASSSSAKPATGNNCGLPSKNDNNQTPSANESQHKGLVGGPAGSSTPGKTRKSRRVTHNVDGTPEQWIDGPKAELPAVSAAAAAADPAGSSSVATLHQLPIGAVTSAGVIAVDETWIDGPREFQKDPNSLFVESYSRSPMKMRLTSKDAVAKLQQQRARVVDGSRQSAAAADPAETSLKSAEANAAAVEGSADRGGSIGVRQFGVDPSRGYVDARVPPLNLYGESAVGYPGGGVTGGVGGAATAATSGADSPRTKARHRSSKKSATTASRGTLATFYSPEVYPVNSAQSSPARIRPPFAGAAAPTPTIPITALRCGDRTAQWVRSVQVGVAPTAGAFHASARFPIGSAMFRFSGFPPTLHSFDRAFRDPFGLLADTGGDSTSDSGTIVIGNNSPPPDYATCVAADNERRRRRCSANLDINENDPTTSGFGRAAAGNGRGQPEIDWRRASVVGLSSQHQRPPSSGNAAAQSAGTPGRGELRYSTASEEELGDSSTWPRRRDCTVGAVSNKEPRLRHPDGASNPKITEELPRFELLIHPDLKHDELTVTYPVHLPTTASQSHSSSHPLGGRTAHRRTKESGGENATTETSARPSLSESTSTPSQNGPSTPSASGTSKHDKRTSSPAAKSSPASCRRKSSSGFSLLSCLSPRARLRSLLSKHYVVDRGDAVDEIPVQPATSEVGVAPTGTAVEASASRHTGERDLRDSDRGSSLGDRTPPPTGARQSEEQQLVHDDASSDYWSVQTDGDAAADQAQLTLEEATRAFGGKLIAGKHSTDIAARPPHCSSAPGNCPLDLSTCDMAMTWFHNNSAHSSSAAAAAAATATQTPRQRVIELLARQAKLRADLQFAKNTLGVEPESWSFDLYVAEQMNRDDPEYVEALERETAILEKRVAACKSRIMMVTVFDVTNT